MTATYTASTPAMAEGGLDPASMVRLPNLRAWQIFLVCIIGILCAAVVCAFAWISDDAFITLTYVKNLLEGRGPVFNEGERVQGFTHPLWFLLLIPTHFVLPNPILAVTFLGVVFTFAMLVMLGFTLFRADRPGVGAGVFILTASVLVSSEAWRSFQTSGLENSLTNLLLALSVIELTRKDGCRALAISVLGSLLFLSRPDLALIVGPMCLLVFYRATRAGQIQHVLWGSVPVAAWLAFAALFYGALLPNTASAKLGINDFATSVSMGVRYLADWAAYEPTSVVAILIFGGIAARTLRTHESRLLLLGCGLYAAYVLAIGGDFMRGRFWLPIFVVTACLGSIALVRLLERQERPSRLAPLALGGAALLAIVLIPFLPAQTAKINAAGIVNERLYYPGFSLRYYLDHDRLHDRNIDFVEELNEFNLACGPFSIHARAVGALGYFRDAEIGVIDLVGLTDGYIAGLTADYLEPGTQRPGHARREIPLGYLASKKDIAIFSDWRDAMEAQHCAIIAQTKDYISSSQRYSHYNTETQPKFVKR